jgi:hypothetical protein
MSKKLLWLICGFMMTAHLYANSDVLVSQCSMQGTLDASGNCVCLSAYGGDSCEYNRHLKRDVLFAQIVPFGTGNYMIHNLAYAIPQTIFFFLDAGFKLKYAFTHADKLDDKHKKFRHYHFGFSAVTLGLWIASLVKTADGSFKDEHGLDFYE